VARGIIRFNSVKEGGEGRLASFGHQHTQPTTTHGYYDNRDARHIYLVAFPPPISFLSFPTLPQQAQAPKAGRSPRHDHQTSLLKHPRPRISNHIHQHGVVVHVLEEAAASPSPCPYRHCHAGAAGLLSYPCTGHRRQDWGVPPSITHSKAIRQTHSSEPSLLFLFCHHYYHHTPR